jgi:hypothetical protein
MDKNMLLSMKSIDYTSGIFKIWIFLILVLHIFYQVFTLSKQNKILTIQ